MKTLDKETDKKLGQVVKKVGSYRVESTVKHKPRSKPALDSVKKN